MGIHLSNGSDGDIVQDPSSALPNEKLGSSSPTMWEGSTIASTQSPTIPSSKYRIMTKSKVFDGVAARSRKKYAWHKRLVRTKRPKPKTETFIRKRKQ